MSELVIDASVALKWVLDEPETGAAIGHPAYDCVYLALAHANGCDFVTADAALARKTLPAGLVCQVVLLGAG